MDSRAFDCFPKEQPVEPQKSPVCVLLGKDNGPRDTTDYCTCGNCVVQPSSVENVCCKETLESDAKFSMNIRKVLGDYRCICSSPLVREIVFHKQDLEYFSMLDSWKSGKQLKSSLDPERHIRFAAYQKLTFLFHGILGMSKRVELPSCLVNFVRKQYPHPNGFYVGFKNAGWTD